MLARDRIRYYAEDAGEANRVSLRWAVTALFLLMIGFAIPLDAMCSIDSDDVNVTSVTDRVFVFDTGKSAVHSNVIAVNTELGIVVIDTHDSPASAQLIRNVIEEMFAGKKVFCVINTHHVFDHTAGNWVFKDVPIIGHTECIAGMSFQDSLINDAVSRAKAQNILSDIPSQLVELEVGSAKHTLLKEIRVFYENFFMAYPVYATTMRPTVLFEDQLALDLGDLTLVLEYTGGLYSASDILICIPEEQVLVVGDLFQKNRLPVVGLKANVQRCIAVTERVIGDGSDVEWVIPGHFDVMTTAEVRSQLDYLEKLGEAVSEAKKNGSTLDEARERLAIEKHFSDYAGFNRFSFYGISADHARNITTLWGMLD
jgi:glyoxylase-like metal-dependent hydrolase (beta-lactamase superfamily II)